MALIDREALLAEIRRYAHLYLTEDQQTALILAVSQIETAPVVDAAPVVHGHWKFTNDYESKCSACGADVGIDHENEYPNCPYCGARMDGGEEHEN